MAPQRQGLAESQGQEMAWDKADLGIPVQNIPPLTRQQTSTAGSEPALARGLEVAAGLLLAEEAVDLGAHGLSPPRGAPPLDWACRAALMLVAPTDWLRGCRDGPARRFGFSMRRPTPIMGTVPGIPLGFTKKQGVCGPDSACIPPALDIRWVSALGKVLLDPRRLDRI